MKTPSEHLLDLKVKANLIQLVDTIADVGTEINTLLRNGALGDILGKSSTINIQGEQQAKLDIISNQLLKDKLLESNLVKAIASEEEDSIVAANEEAEFIIAYDPLDGSSNIDINGQVGTIFSIFPAKQHISAHDAAQFYQTGSDQVCAGYILYGPATQLVIAVAEKVCSFTLNENKQFILTDTNISIPKTTDTFAINMSNFEHWNEHCKLYILQLQQGEAGPRGKKYNMRWNGAMVGDVHRTLLKGGIFLYPTSHFAESSKAKLRLLYEAFPMAMITELAGGKAFSSDTRILDEKLTTLHQRIAVVLGSSDELDNYLSLR